MQVTNKAFKAYDVRGVYPTEVSAANIAEKIRPIR